MHRFYIFHPIQMFPLEVTAAAALYLGCKSESQARHSVQIIKSLMKILNRPEPTPTEIEAYKEEINIVEHFMAMTLSFDFDARLPTKNISNACNLFNIGNYDPHHLKSLIDCIASNR